MKQEAGPPSSCLGFMFDFTCEAYERRRMFVPLRNNDFVERH